jgi:hypothetical protein
MHHYSKWVRSFEPPKATCDGDEMSAAVFPLNGIDVKKCKAARPPEMATALSIVVMPAKLVLAKGVHV